MFNFLNFRQGRRYGEAPEIHVAIDDRLKDGPPVGSSCVGLTALYTVFAKREGIDLSVEALSFSNRTSRHVRNVIMNGSRKIVIENTTTHGFNDITDEREQIESSGEPNILIPLTYGVRSQLSLEKGKTKEAVRIAFDGLKHLPQSDLSYWNIVGVLSQTETQNPEHAILFAKTALRLRPTSFGYMILGEVYANSGKPSECIKALRKALELNPTDMRAMINLAGIHMQLGERLQAKELYDHARSLNPSKEYLNVIEDALEGNF